MLAATTAGTWDISGTHFLWGYGALCAATAVGVWQAYRRALGPPAGPTDPLPDLSVCQLGLVSGGPDCAITAAAARLYHDGLVRIVHGSLAPTGELDSEADPIEREFLETVSRHRSLSVDEMRTRVRESASMRALTEQMTRAGLLLDQPQARRVRLLWIIPALVTTLGLARILAGLVEDRPFFVLAVMTAIAGVATARLLALRPEGTRRGQDMLARLREGRDSRPPESGGRQIALTVALFGAGTLWLAESAIASALGVPREEDPSVPPGGGAGCGGCGGGGCGGCGGCGG